MAAKKKKKKAAKSKKPAKRKATKAPARKGKAKKAKAKSAGKTKAKKTKKTRRAPAVSARVVKAVKKAVTPARKKAKKQTVGEGDYAATRKFDKDQAGFVASHQSEIPGLGKAAKQALEGPEGDSLRDAEATAAGRSRDNF